MSSLVAGIDISSHAIDCVLVSEDTGLLDSWHRWPLTAKGDAFDRTRWVRDTMPSRGWWADMGVIAAGIEDPAGNHGVRTIARVQGAVIACLPTWLLVHPLPPSSWRKAVGLAGNASKRDVARLVLEDGGYALHPENDWTYDGWPQDAFDALCIAWAARSLIEKQAA